MIDPAASTFEAPIEITPELEQRRFFAAPGGLVVNTAGCLQQHIRIGIYDTAPNRSKVEEMSGNPWTQSETAGAHFPSRKFTLSSPSMPYPLPAGPLFLLDAERVSIRIQWMEFQGSRDDSVPIEPDVIELTLWPS